MNDSKMLFLKWLERNEPVIYARVMKNEGIAGIEDIFNKAVSVIKDVAPAVTQYKAQSQILKVQLKRAEQGLPPLDTSNYAPTLRVQPEFTPETNLAIRQGVGASISNYMPIILLVGGLAVAYLVMRKRG